MLNEKEGMYGGCEVIIDLLISKFIVFINSSPFNVICTCIINNRI